MAYMSTITFSDGQTVDSDKIIRVGVLEREEKLQVETADGPIQIQGAGVHADLALLKDVKSKERLYFMVHEK
jgi:hypothetical protein